MLGEVGSDATVINADKEAVAKAITAAAVSEAGFESLEAAKDAGTAFVFMGHGTAHVAKVTYSQMQTQMQNLGYENVFIGTVEGEPEETSCRGRHRGRQGCRLHQRRPAPADGRCRRSRQQRYGRFRR